MVKFTGNRKTPEWNGTAVGGQVGAFIFTLTKHFCMAYIHHSVVMVFFWNKNPQGFHPQGVTLKADLILILVLSPPKVAPQALGFSFVQRGIGLDRGVPNLDTHESLLGALGKRGEGISWSGQLLLEQPLPRWLIISEVWEPLAPRLHRFPFSFKITLFHICCFIFPSLTELSPNPGRSQKRLLGCF